VTIITHGFEDDSYPTWVTAMADNIPNYFQARYPGLESNCSTYKLTMTNIGETLYYYPPSRTNGSPPTATQSGEIIIELDWSALSGDLDDSYASTYNVAYAVSQVLMATNSFPELNGHPAIEFPIHLVGHSRGGSLMSQISYVLGTNGIWTDHLTTLDPYPLNNDGNIDPATEVDAPAKYTYSSVLFADNYWQDLGVGAYLGDPDGEPVAGAYVRQLFDLSGGYWNISSLDAPDHSNVHLWYHGTIDLHTPASDTGATITSTERAHWWVNYEQEGTNAGFEYSLIGGGNRMSTDEPVGQDYPAIVDGYNQWWDFGAGNSANRTMLSANNGTWPNIIKFDVIGTNIVATGQTIATKFYYQYGGASNNVTAQFYFDGDFNPYNTNSTFITQTSLTNTGVNSVYYDSINLTTTNVSPGVYAIYAKISDGVHTRYLYTPEQVEIVPLQQAPGISLSGNLAFGNVAVGSSAQSTLTISNGGNSTLTVTNISYPTGFTGNWSGTIAAGNMQQVTVTFSPTAATIYGGTVTVHADNTSGVDTIPISGIGESGGLTLTSMSLSGNLAFGNVAVGSSAQSTLTISNTGNSTLTVSNISYPTGFSGNWSGTIVAGSSQQVTVTFSPTAATIYGVVATVNADNTIGVDLIPISGIGVSGDLTSMIVTIVTNGDGAVSPNLNGKLLKAGKNYTIKAVAGSGYVFSNWSGDITSAKNPLSFMLESNMVLQANFIPNPFLPLKGTYNGLFSATNGVTEETAGMLKGLTVRQTGAYSGTLIINGGSHVISGAFDLSGQATNQILRPASQGGSLTVVMTLLSSSNSAPQDTGTVSGTTNGGSWVASLTADLATNSLPSAEYTMLIPPDTNNGPPDSSPGGDGYALITNHAGTAKVTGALADGTAFSQSVPVSQDGYVPVYANLYGNKGLLLCWINLDLTNTNAVTATGLTWIHPTRTTGLYQKGFTNILLTNQILLSLWTNLPGNIDTLTNLSILDTINDTNALTNVAVKISSAGKVTEATGSPVTVSGSITPKTGLLKVTIGSGATRVTGHGAILLNSTNGGSNYGAGYYLTKTNAGAVLLEP
jgi:hypothetical protein